MTTVQMEAVLIVTAGVWFAAWTALSIYASSRIWRAFDTGKPQGLHGRDATGTDARKDAFYEPSRN